MKVKLLTLGLVVNDGTRITTEYIRSAHDNFSAPVAVTLGPYEFYRKNPTFIGDVVSVEVSPDGSLVGTIYLDSNGQRAVDGGEVPCAVITEHDHESPRLTGAFLSSTPMIQNAVVER